MTAPSAGAPLGAAGVTLNVERLLDCLPAPRSPAMRASQVRSLRTLRTSATTFTHCCSPLTAKQVHAHPP